MSDTLNKNQLTALHQMAQLLHTIDNGLVVLDRQYRIGMWNRFMESHSGISANTAQGRELFELIPGMPERWLQRKIESVFALRSPVFCTWEEYPHLFPFKSARPLTGRSPLMYQNATLLPLTGLDQQVSNVCLLLYDMTDVANHKKELETANRTLQRVSRIDRLTGLNNRGYWEECLESEFQRCKRNSRPASLLMLDIDHFKRFNDTHGHQAGDEVLREFANVLQRLRRSTDVVGRYGGEEFAVILPETTPALAMIMAERVRQHVEALEVAWGKQRLSVTVSVGISGFHQEMESHQQWIQHADEALYQAKAQGRNRSVILPWTSGAAPGLEISYPASTAPRSTREHTTQ